MNVDAYPSDVISNVLESVAPYANDEQRDVCKCLVLELTEEEQELAAQSSYSYWLFSKRRHPAQNACATDELNGDSNTSGAAFRLRLAMREARRHLVAENDDFTLALDRLRGACHYRKDHHLDIVRTCFDAESENPDRSVPANETFSTIYDECTSPEQLRALFRKYVTLELEKQIMVVRGKDRSNRAIVIKMPRVSSDMNVEAYVVAHIYLAERAIAATEYLSRGKEEKVVAVFDFGNYSSRNSPSIVAIRRLLSALQQNYPERLKYLVVVDPPMWMRGLVNIIYPFLATDTKEKICLVSGETQRRKTLNELIEPEQAMPFMLPDGKLEAPIDINHFLNHVPFYGLYDT